jgi:Protein of unknown function (DUF2510)
MTGTAEGFAAGWYADPHGGAPMRWWDGAQWTEHTHEAAEPAAASAQEAPGDVPAPTPVVTAESEAAITSAQVEHLQRMASLRGLISRSFEWALYVPVAIWLLGWTLSRVVLVVPLVGWVFALWGFVGTVAVALAALILSPVLALVMLPFALLTKRPRLKQDITAGRAKRVDGTFLVFERNYGGTVAAGDHRYDISKDQFAALRPVLLGNNERKEYGLEGTIVHTVAAREILAAYDASGRVLFDCASG